MNPAIELEIFKLLFAAIPEEMGALLKRSAYSPNIKERRDYSCAIFNTAGEMIAQAAHIPVHLGAMPLSVQLALAEVSFEPDDIVILNDPYRGGTHLPDITLISPVFVNQACIGFVANRAHHADIGGMAPGSMPIARELIQEGLILPPVKLVAGGQLQRGVWEILLANVRTPEERAGDLRAQLAANQRGVTRLQELVSRYGIPKVQEQAAGLLDYSERLVRALLHHLPDGRYAFADQLDGDGISESPLPLQVVITIQGEQATVDFTGTAPQAAGSVNAVYAITLSAVHYVFHCLLAPNAPNNSGSLRPIRVIAPEGTLVNARRPAPVAGGNVETSQRITDILLGALAQAAPDRIPAASQGTMNNVLIGGWNPFQNTAFTYYETLAGGMGGRPGLPGESAIHTHMTNTLNTPAEALEFSYPIQVVRYAIRPNTGGQGRYPGGNGLQRDMRLLAPATISLLTERRTSQPYGMAGGKPGAVGENILVRSGQESPLPAKGSIELQTNDILSIRTPGGGGWGQTED